MLQIQYYNENDVLVGTYITESKFNPANVEEWDAFMADCERKGDTPPGAPAGEWVRYELTDTPKKITRKEVAEVLGVGEEPGALVFYKGAWTLRRGYYYRPKHPQAAIWEGKQKKLEDAGFRVTSIEMGDHYAAFCGSAPIQKQSHYWYKFTLVRRAVE